MEFQRWPKIPRLNREMIISEKIDGTNAQVSIDFSHAWDMEDTPDPLVVVGEFGIWAGSRKRWLTREQDNFGFAKWVEENADDLLTLGPGRHFGEYWGKGIQRKYGLDHKRFSLFNVSRYADDHPECCHVVPVLHEGPFSVGEVDDQIQWLRDNGSIAAPGFMKPEGVVVFHVAANKTFKVTCENDERPKGLDHIGV